MGDEVAGKPGGVEGKGTLPSPVYAAEVLQTRPVPMLPLVAGLAEHGDRPALLGPDGAVPYAVLAARVAAVAARLGTRRRLVLLAGAQDEAGLTAYLGALAAGCPVLLVPPGERSAAWVEAYDPDVVLTGGQLLERRAVTRHDLHPDLALLLTTSGSTGSPKLVRLSQDNLQANAEAVAEALGVRPDDRALTTVPVHHSYGLSVVHSHLLRGATVVPTSLSVADECLWALLEQTGATTLPGVPYTFDLLERVGFADRVLPSLRLLTCAGGRLAPDRVRHWAQVGRRRGFDLSVMYGQTEATARICVLPAALALEHPDAVGYAVPGTRVHVDAGEVVVEGPGVMLGYAEGPADLARGRSLDVLRTGDLGTLDEDGLLRITGRRQRTAKVLGLRIDLDHLEAALAGPALCVEDDGVLVAAVQGPGDDAALRRQVAAAAGLPVGAVRAAHVVGLPRLDCGKPDRCAVARLVPPSRRPLTDDLRTLYADVLDREDLTDDSTFVSAGGDSLSYVELSLRLEDVLGHLPPSWHTTPLRELRPAVRRHRGLETSVALRAIAIVLVVSFHSNALAVVGGAHLLVGVAGFNVARFALGPSPRRERLRQLGVSAARIGVPTVLLAAGVALVTGDYGLATVLQANVAFGPREFDPSWQLWFVEALLQLLAVVAVVVAGADRLERRWPFGLALAVVGVGLVTREVLPGGPDGIHTSPAVLWLFGLGWAAARAPDALRKGLVTLAVLATVPGSLGDGGRESVVVVGLLALIWLREMPCPRGLRRLAGVLASSSLYVYLTHWQVYPLFEVDHPWLGVLASLAVGVATWQLVERTVSATAGWGRRRLRRPSAGSARRP